MIRKRTFKIQGSSLTAVVEQVRTGSGFSLRVTFSDGWVKSFPLSGMRVQPEYAVDFAILAREAGEPSE